MCPLCTLYPFVHADLWPHVQPAVCSLQPYVLSLQSELRTLFTHCFVLSLRTPLQPHLLPLVRAVL